MNTILGYIINMFPYMLITIPIHLLIRLIYIRKNKISYNWYHEIVLLFFIIFVVGLSSQTIIPKFEFGINGFIIISNRVHETNLIPFKVLIETYEEVFLNNNINYFIINFLGNIIMFIPFGFIIPLLWNISNRRVIIIGFCISLFIEISQLFLSRGTDVDDLILNTLGVLFGLIIFKLLYRKYYNYMNRFKIVNGDNNER